MELHAELPQPVIDALARGWTVLTGNQRAARTFRFDYDLRQRSAGRLHWTPPAILAWDSWLASLWHRLLLDGHASDVLLNATQEHSLWRAIVAADANAPALRPLDSLAELAADAWSRLHAYGVQHRLHAAASTTDTRAFARWAGEFQRLCLRGGYITAAQLPERLAAAADAGRIAPPAGLLLVGFDAVLPAQAALLDALAASGTAMEYPEPPRRTAGPARALLVEAADLNHELLACACWLSDRLAEDPDVRLAIVVADIESERAGIERIFRNVFAPELNSVDAPARSAPFEFSLGTPLDRTPIVAAALDILSWAAGPISLDRVSALLLSPHFAAASSVDNELLARAEFDAFTLRARRFLEPQITIDSLASLLARSNINAQLPLLRAQLHTLSTAVRRANLDRGRSYGEWAATFQGILDAAGWAPPGRLDSAEFQTRRKWESALDELATLDFHPQFGRASFQTAHSALARIAAQTLFAPESRHAPIQIMGPLEAAGSSFDALWLLRASDLAWPPASRTNPLLPYSLQRDFAMPGADVQADTARALQITQRIASSAPAVLFSYARQAADGHQHSSPALAALDLELRSADSIAFPAPDPVPVPLDALLDDTPIPLPPASLRGGAAILESQAACGFRAFAERRLFSTPLDHVSLGLDARDRGSLVHSVLHDFWSRVRTQAALLAMTGAERDAVLTECIDAALAHEHQRSASGWAAAYLNAERERLLRVLGPWLEFEAHDRPPFAVQSSEEVLKAVPIGPLHLDIRVDRVDQTVPPAGSRDAPAEIILDYKTGRADPSAWEGARPDSPQLPLYAVVSKAPRLAAIAFAGIRPGKLMGLSGYQSEPGILPMAKRGHTRDLEAQREQWREVLTGLAEQFHAGYALASPKNYPDTCVFCRQRLLCRLDPSALGSSEDPADVDEPADSGGPAIAGTTRSGA